MSASSPRASSARRSSDLLNVFEELNQSGRRADRPLLETAARRIEEGISDCIVVATVDRFGRSQLDGLQMIRRVQDAGGHFFSARDDFDLGSEVGRYLCRELLSIAEFESDRLGVAWQQAKLKIIERGAWPTPKVPFGYRTNRRGRLVPDPVRGPCVTELFSRRAAGATVGELCAFLELSGVRTPSGNVGWALRSVEGILRDRVYLGEIHWGTELRYGAHEPLTDGPTWERAQRPPTTRRATSTSKPTVEKALLRGVRRALPRASLRSADALDAYVQDAVLQLLRKRRPERPRRLLDAEQRVDEAQAALRRYRDNRSLSARLDPDVFAEGVLVRDAAVRAARLEVALAQEADQLRRLDTADEIAAEWPDMSPEQRPRRDRPGHRLRLRRSGTDAARVPGHRLPDRHRPARPPSQRRQAQPRPPVPATTGALRPATRRHRTRTPLDAPPPARTSAFPTPRRRRRT